MPRVSRRASAALLIAGILIAAPRAALPQSATSHVSEDVAVPGGLAALSRAMDLEAVDPPRVVAELTRLVYRDAKAHRDEEGSSYRRLIAYLKGVDRAAPAGVPLSAGSRPADVVPIALSPSAWSQSIFRRPIPAAELFAAVMADRSAALLATGLAALDDATLEYLVEHPGVLTKLYENGAAAFSGFAAHLRIRDNHVEPAGGAPAAAVWQALLGESVAKPERFVPALFARKGGRLAYLYDTIGALDAPRRAFALGAWLPDPGRRRDRFNALAAAATSAFGEWDVKGFPFKRPAHDLLSMLQRVEVDPTGRPRFPAARHFWACALDSTPSRDVPLLSREADSPDELIDAAWLAELLLEGEGRRRLERLDQFAFGHRVFAAASDSGTADAVAAIRAFPRYRMLMLTLERIGVSEARVFSAFARRAEEMSALDPARGHTALAQVQGAIGLIVRLLGVRSIDRAMAQRLLSSLAAVPVDRRRGYAGGVAEWFQAQLGPALGLGGDRDTALVAALAGAAHLVPARPISWEGQQYRFDLVRFETRRLGDLLERPSAHSVDMALRLHAVARRLTSHAMTPQGVQSAAVDLETLAFAARSQLTPADTLTPSAHLLSQIVEGAIAQLTTPHGAPDARQVTGVAQSLLDGAGIALGEALLVLNYAVHWPAFPPRARFVRGLALRHDFGLAKHNLDLRKRTAWVLPVRSITGSGPWHVEGSVLGLELALAPLALRRVSMTPPAGEPLLSPPERDTFTQSLALMNPYALSDLGRDHIAEAVGRGRRRVEELAPDPATWQIVTDEIAMDGWRVRALQWTLRHDPPRAASLFSLIELLALGEAGHMDVHAWGMSAMSANGCVCTRLTPPGLGPALIGRHHVGLLATTVADLNLRVAEWLSATGLPAALATSVLAVAVQDFFDRASPTDPDDWLTLVRAAQRFSREQFEDAVALATADGPLLPETGSLRHQP
jgi:hypothetical protein